MRRNVKAGGMLSLGRPYTLGDIFGCGSQTVEYERLLAGFWGREVMRHCFGGTGGRNMLESKLGQFGSVA